MTEDAIIKVIQEFAKVLAAGDENERNAWIARAKMLAMNQAEPEAFEPPIRSLGEYLDTPLEVPPVLVEPNLIVRGGMLCTVARAGYGKEQPHYAKILTPTGWTTMGEVAPGDEVVDPTTGRPATVIGKFPQGIKPVYRIEFNDGAVTCAGAEHLWATSRKGRAKIRTTMELRRGDGVPLPYPSDLPTSDYRPLDPWLVGFLLGDGSLTQDVRFSTADAEIVEKIRLLLPTCAIRHHQNYDWLIRGGTIYDEIRQLGMNCKAAYKRVPPQYMAGTASSRLEVLRGLMDSDGHASGEFCSMSRGLVEDVIELTRSLGGLAKLCKRRPSGAWRCVVRMHVCPFALSRKVNAWRPRTLPCRYVRSVSLLCGTAESSCIMLDSEAQLYVTDDYIVTHNTQMNLNRIMRWGCGKPMFDGLTDKQGKHILGPTQPLKTLLIENEGAPGMFHRQLGIMLNAAGYLTEEDRKLVRENVLVWGDGGWSGLKLDDQQQLDQLRIGIEKYQPDLVFIEPFRGLWKGDENSSTDMAVVADALSYLATTYDCGVIITHHERKSGVGEDGEKMSAGRGSTVLEGVVATMENFEKAKGGDFREISWSKVRYNGGHAIVPVRLEWQAGDWWYRHVAADEIEQAILNELADASPDALTIREIRERTEEKDTKIRDVMKVLVAADKVAKAPSKSDGSGSTGVRYRLKTPMGGEEGMEL